MDNYDKQNAVSRHNLSPAARQALAEAQQRREEHDRAGTEVTHQEEINGRGGKEPIRYGDWEIKGLASDF
jgi:hypothetical protein